MESKTFKSSFAENIIRGGPRTAQYWGRAPRRASVPKQPRFLIFLILLLISFFIGVARLVDLQIIRGAYFRELAEGNRIRRIPIKAPRGEILDRTGKVLARNLPVYKLAKFSEGGVVVETKVVSREEALSLQTDPTAAPNIIIDIGREYPLGPKAAHVLGYVGEANAEEVGKIPECGGKALDTRHEALEYQLGDLVGRMGIEAQYECLLRGINGEELIEVDTRGHMLRKLGRQETVPGKTIKLAIDSALQENAYDALIKERDKDGDGKVDEGVTRGAAVAQDPETGEILALVSLPSFSPAKIAELYESLAKDENMPFFNRAVGGAYHPGSTFKIITSVAGLEDGKIDRNYEFDDPGIIRIGDFSFANWYFAQYGRKEGVIDLTRAITRSTDTFFYKLGETVGPQRLAFWADRFGLGKKTGVDLPGEVSGLVPTPEWKEKVRNERWFLGNTYHMSIGQGDITATPLQINRMTSVVASGGKLCRPYLLQMENGRWKMENCQDLGLRLENLDLITRGMVGACSTGGTAFPFFTFTPGVACKTGTAETKKEGVTHAWLTSFAPVATDSAEVKLEIVVTALVEEGGEGSRVATPVVRDILDYWFNKK